MIAKLSLVVILVACQCLLDALAFAPDVIVQGPLRGSPLSASSSHEQQRQDWIDRSLSYYSKVMREERRRSLGQWRDFDSDDYVLLAKKHYFAIRKVKDGKFTQAETIYRKIIDEILQEQEHCNHAKLAVTTLLLALLTKRMGDPKKTRSVFLRFFRIAVLQRDEDDQGECACSAKVLQAYALFEMQQGNPLKSVEIVQTALHFDKTLAPVLKWKQFRDARRAFHNKRYGNNVNDNNNVISRATPRTPQQLSGGVATTKDVGGLGP
jgi:hypothetical protein